MGLWEHGGSEVNDYDDTQEGQRPEDEIDQRLGEKERSIVDNKREAAEAAEQLHGIDENEIPHTTVRKCLDRLEQEIENIEGLEEDELEVVRKEHDEVQYEEEGGEGFGRLVNNLEYLASQEDSIEEREREHLEKILDLIEETKKMIREQLDDRTYRRSLDTALKRVENRAQARIDKMEDEDFLAELESIQHSTE